MVYSYNGILLCDKKEQTTDIHNNIDESQKHHTKWKKPHTKDYPWFHLYETLEKVKHCDNSRLVVIWGWDWHKGTECKGAGDNFLEWCFRS